MADHRQDVATPEPAAAVTTVEIRIRTLDSSNYTIRVDKDMPVPALKDQLAPVVGVPSQDQRLICRGRVLKDDQLLSSYNVEDGHTLHLVARPPAPVSAEDATTQESPARSRATFSHSVVLGTINFPEVAEGPLPELGRILSAVFGSGATAIDNRRGVAVMQVSSGLPASGGLPSTNAPAAATSTTVPSGSAEGRRSGHSAGDSLHFRNVEVVPDALTTIAQYLTRMEQAFSDNGYGSPSIMSALFRPGHSASSSAAAGAPPRPLPTPASLAAAISRVQELLHGQTSSAFTNLAAQLDSETSLSDTTARADLQSMAVWSGNIMQQLGALLMELGRTTLTLRLGTSPPQAVVNSGPAVFVSPSGPNPMMVQPLPFQTGLAFNLGASAGQSEPAPGSFAGSTRTVGMNLSANDTGRRPFPSIPLFSAALQNATDSLASALEDGGQPAGQPAAEASDARQQSSDAARQSPSEQESSEQNLGLLVQENGTVRLVPVRARTSASVNLHSTTSLFRGLRSSSEAVSVPVLGIRAQVHAHPWTQAVLQASEGQRPVGIAVTIPVDVTTSRLSGQGGVASAEAGHDSASNANREPEVQVDVSNLEQQTQARADQHESVNEMDTNNCKSEDANERSSRKRGGQEEAATDGAESCMSTSPDSEELQSAQGGGSVVKRQKTDHSE